MFFGSAERWTGAEVRVLVVELRGTMGAQSACRQLDHGYVLQDAAALVQMALTSRILVLKVCTPRTGARSNFSQGYTGVTAACHRDVVFNTEHKCPARCP